MDLLKQLNDRVIDQQLHEQFDQQTVDSDVAKIVSFYKGKDMQPDQLANAIGDELEQLEYDPQQIEQLLPKIIQLITS